MLAIGVGILLLLLGRQLYWIVVGVLGFVAGMTLAEQLVGEQAGLIVLAIAVLAGLLGAVLAVALQSVMVALAGFAIGGQLAASLFDGAGGSLANGVPAAWLPYVIGGIIGAVLVLLAFDWALIVLSSLLGASLVTQPLATQRPLGVGIFVAAFAIGVAVQFLQMYRNVQATPDGYE